MKITSVDIWTVRVPAIPDMVTSREWQEEIGFDKSPTHVIRLNTDTELYGIGDSGRGFTIEDVRTGAALLLGRDPEQLTLKDVYATRSDGSELDLRVGRGPVYAGFEMAVFDLIGRARDVPVHALIGGAVRDKVRADYWMSRQTPEDSKSTAERALKAGFRGVKIKCLLEDPMVERLQAICDVGGVDFKVAVDPNGRFYTVEQTLELTGQLEGIGNVGVLEDPIPKADIDGLTQIHAACNLPIALHCNWPDPLKNRQMLLQAITAGAIDCVNLSGGLWEFVQIGAIAEAAGLQCWHASGNDLGIAEMSYVHAAAATPNCTMPSDFVSSWTREDDLTLEPMTFDDGYIATPMGPGLGCELDIKALEKYGLVHETVSVR